MEDSFRVYESTDRFGFTFRHYANWGKFALTMPVNDGGTVRFYNGLYHKIEYARKRARSAKVPKGEEDIFVLTPERATMVEGEWVSMPGWIPPS